MSDAGGYGVMGKDLLIFSMMAREQGGCQAKPDGCRAAKSEHIEFKNPAGNTWGFLFCALQEQRLNCTDVNLHHPAR